MKLVIEIPDHIYEHAKNISEDSSDEWEAMRAIAKGLPYEPRPQRPSGEWIFKNDNPLIPTGYWECSNCKKGRLMVEENFCPNCGAVMRKRRG